MDDKIIPFGKHKGKPIEILAADKQYSEWLLAQSWFKERHINLYNIVINNFREPIDTPEHNKLQIKFLKKEYRLKFAYAVNKNLFNNNSEKINSAMHKILASTERRENDYFLRALANPINDHGQKFGLYSNQLLKFSTPVFEKIDVSFSLWYGIHFHYDNNFYEGGWSNFSQESRTTYFIEIKPTISDDFPAVLRQMKASMPCDGYNNYQKDKFFVLLVGSYTGTSATREEFIEYFATQGYIVIFENDVENLILPNFDKELRVDDSIIEKINSIKKV